MIVTMYRPPSVHISKLTDAIDHLSNVCENECKTYFIMGDLNVNFLGKNKDKDDLGNILDVYDFSNVIKSPTCFKGANPTLIDVILTNCPERVSESSSIDTGISDFHNMVLTSTKIQLPKPVKGFFRYRSYKSFNEEKFVVDLEAAPFHVAGIFDDVTVDDAMWFHDTLLSNVINEHAPLKSKRARANNAPFMNGNLRREINIKRTLRKKSKKYKGNWEAYRVQRNKVTSLRKLSIKRYFRDRCDHPFSQQTFWKTIRPFLTENSKCSQSRTIILMDDENLTHGAKDVCDIFNDFFISAGRNSPNQNSVSQDKNAPPGDVHESLKKIETEMNDSYSAFEFQPVNEEHVLKVLLDLNDKKATGPDNIPAKLLKIGAEAICPSLTGLINMSITSSKFPSDLKKANVLPVYKKGDSLNKSNYRPVSILSSISKIFESVLNEQMTNFFKDILNSLLCAFRKNYSCQSLLIKIIEDWKLALDKHESVGVILMDLSKAFDCLPHDLLLCKLKSYGFSDNACKLMGSYLTDREQRVKYGGSFSQWTSILRGVPQGSILGPLLFNIFMNDFFFFLEGKCDLYNYADDNTLSVHDQDLRSLKTTLETAAQIGIKWFNDNDMKVNPDKFQAMLLTSRTQCHPDNYYFEIEGVKLKPEKSVKLLGVYIDDKLKFHDHITHICKQAAKQISVLRRFSTILSQNEKMQIFNAFILSNFNYCPLVWHLCGQTDTNKMEKIQERALRFVLNDHNSTYSDLLQRANKPSLYLSRLRKLSIEVYKIITHNGPIFLESLFESYETPYNLRDNNRIQQPAYNTVTYGRNSVRYQGAKLWNILPLHIKEATTLPQFKRLIHTWLGPSCKCSICVLCHSRM